MRIELRSRGRREEWRDGERENELERVTEKMNGIETEGEKGRKRERRQSEKVGKA